MCVCVCVCVCVFFKNNIYMRLNHTIESVYYNLYCICKYKITILNFSVIMYLFNLYILYIYIFHETVSNPKELINEEC